MTLFFRLATPISWYVDRIAVIAVPATGPRPGKGTPPIRETRLFRDGIRLESPIGPFGEPERVRST